MQFQIRTLIVVIAVVAVLCALTFATPRIIALPLLCSIVWILPSLWISGIVFGRGAWRSFFIGGAAAGSVPYLIAIYYSINVVLSLLSESDTYALYQLSSISEPWPNLAISIVFLAPVIFAALGGLVGLGTYWRFR